MAILAILSRWLHVISACLAIGGGVFIRFIQPVGLSQIAPDLQQAVFLKNRRVFKMVIHTAILLFLVTGAFNSYLAWGKYELAPARMHPLWGTHVLLGLAAICISLYLLAGAQPPPTHRKLMAINLAILLLAVAAASSLKYVRDQAVAQHSQTLQTP